MELHTVFELTCWLGVALTLLAPTANVLRERAWRRRRS